MPIIIALSPTQIIFSLIGLIILGFLIISAILVYHWQKYGLHRHTVLVVMTVYFLVSIILLAVIINTGLTILSSWFQNFTLMSK